MGQQCNSIRKRPEVINLSNAAGEAETSLIKVGRQGWYDFFGNGKSNPLEDTAEKPAGKIVRIYKGSMSQRSSLIASTRYIASR